MIGRDVLLIGLSGPDGAGKTTLAAELASAAERAGRRATILHVYGCIFCRWFAGTGGTAAARAQSHPVEASVSAAGAVHALVESLEFGLRLDRASARLGRAGVLIADRTPLDALVKHDPGPGSRTAFRFARQLALFDRVFWLDAPAEVLAERDHEHDVATLDAARARFAAWAERLPGIERLNVVQRPALLIQKVAEEVGI